MDSNKKEMADRFRRLNDSELRRRVEAGTLTAVGTEVALAELAARGIQMPTVDAVTDDVVEDVASLPPGVDLVTIKHFVNPMQASLARSHLESEGIFVHLWGEHLGIAHILFSAATGGMRLQVRSDQAARAREILDAFERGDYSLGEESTDDRLG